MKMLIASLALATLVAFPAFAQSYDPDLGTGNVVSSPDSTIATRNHGGFARTIPGGAGSPTAAYGAITPFGTPAPSRNGGDHSSAAREQALRDCSAIARRYTQTTWGNMEAFQHRACMTQHGEME